MGIHDGIELPIALIGIVEVLGLGTTINLVEKTFRKIRIVFRNWIVDIKNTVSVILNSKI